jgi:hypothetical protein
MMISAFLWLTGTYLQRSSVGDPIDPELKRIVLRFLSPTLFVELDNPS